jgi:tetratricopeptide (TPR) repeat protein
MISSVFAQDFQPERLKQISKGEIDKYEIELKKYFKDLNPKELQKKYFLASRHFSQVGEIDKATYILEKGLKLAEPDIEYVRDLLSYYDFKKQKDRLKETYTQIIEENKFSVSDKSLLTEVIMIALRNFHVLSSEIKTPHLKANLKAIEDKTQMKWIDSITYTLRGNYKEALAEVKSLKPQGEEDKIYVSYLQKKNKLIPKFCMQVDRRIFYKKSCEVLLTKDNKIEEELKQTKEIMEFTPLYEVL